MQTLFFLRKIIFQLNKSPFHRVYMKNQFYNYKSCLFDFHFPDTF